MRSARGLHFLDGALDRAVGFDRLAGRLLDRGDLGGDVVGRARGLAGEALHFLRDDREAAAGIAGARRLDRGVEREQVGLAGNVADQAEDRFDRLDMGGERLADLHRLAGLVAGAGGDAGGDFDFAAGFLDRADQAGGGLRRFAHRDRRLLGGGGDFAGLAEHAARRSGGRAGALGQRLRLVGAGADQLGDSALELLALAAALRRRPRCASSKRRPGRAMMSVSMHVEAVEARDAVARACRGSSRKAARPVRPMTRLGDLRALAPYMRAPDVLSAIDLDGHIRRSILDPGAHRPCRQ